MGKTDIAPMVQFTGIVVTYNEARRLRECLNSLAFCDQLIVVDLGSTDESVEIARECGAEVVHHERVEVVEDVQGKAAAWAAHDWIVFLDPDEVLPDGIREDFEKLIEDHPRLGMIGVPWQFYFRGKPLTSTIWGQETRHKAVVRHRDRVLFNSKVHRGYDLRPGYECIVLDRRSKDYCIKHYWVDSYRQMLAKHWRYIKREGEARYQSGERFWWRRWVWETRQALRQNLFDYGGLKGGFTGIFLSFFYAWYVCMSLLSLWRYQSKVEKGHALPNPE